MPSLRFLVYGAGVIGSVYASRLLRRHDVTLLARGSRLAGLRDNGLVLMNEDTGELERHAVRVIDRLDPADRYDFILVAMRCQQALEILPALRENCSPNVVFLMNGVTSYDRWREALGSRMLSAFPVLGGEVRDGVVRYALGIDRKGSLRATVLGAPDGAAGSAAALAEALGGCGMPARVIRRMRDYHFMHVALVSPIANALYGCGGSNYALAGDRAALRQMLLAVRENMRALRAKGIRTVPGSLRVLLFAPLWAAVPAAVGLFNTAHMETVAARHARNARDEMAWLYGELMEFCADSGVRMERAQELGKNL